MHKKNSAFFLRLPLRTDEPTRFGPVRFRCLSAGLGRMTIHSTMRLTELRIRRRTMRLCATGNLNLADSRIL